MKLTLMVLNTTPSDSYPPPYSTSHATSGTKLQRCSRFSLKRPDMASENVDVLGVTPEDLFRRNMYVNTFSRFEVVFDYANHG
jgi:hypothetical protein